MDPRNAEGLQKLSLGPGQGKAGTKELRGIRGFRVLGFRFGV